jgi:N-formylglutamate deformylase
MTSSISVLPGVFMRYEATGTRVPVVVDVSRSGREYPHDFRSPIPFSTLHDNVSMYVEELCAGAPALGATMLYACFPNTYVDTNRSAADIDERLIDGKWPGSIEQSDFTSRGLGLIKRLSRYGEEMQERKLTVQRMFIDTKTFKRTQGFTAVRATMDHLVERVCQYAVA